MGHERTPPRQPRAPVSPALDRALVSLLGLSVGDAFGERFFMPHAALQEIRIERKDAAASQQQVLLKLSFFYQSEAKAAAPVAAATAPANTRGSLP